MKLTPEEVKHIAELSRLELSPEETEKYRGELGAILDYVAMLKEVETEGVDITAQVSGLTDVFREDKAVDWNKEEVEIALGQGEIENGNVKVKRVL